MAPEQEFATSKEWPETEVCRMLAAKIRKARQDSGETQAEFADRAGVSVRTYKRSELNDKARCSTSSRRCAR